jgi:hypothetical protein
MYISESMAINNLILLYEFTKIERNSMTNVHQPILVHKTGRSEEESQLDAPDIPSAFHDDDTPGLLPIELLSAPVIIEFKVWDAAKPGFTYQLVWDGNNEGTDYKIDESHRPGDLLTLEVPMELLTEGRHSVAYKTFNPVSLVANYSKAFGVYIDKTPPGSPELAAVQFPREVEGGLTAAELEALGGTLVAHIAGYTGMAKHDSIRIYWGDIELPAVTVDQDDMGLDKVLIAFDREFLETVGEDEQLVKYKVYDRAGNVSIDSNVATVQVNLKEIPTDFPAPIIDPGVGSLIDYTEAQIGVQIQIPAYTNPAALDLVQIYWSENYPMVPVSVPPGNEGDSIVLTLKIPFETINQMPTGDIDVSYEVSRGGKIVGRSLSSSISVFLTLPVAYPLDKLTVQGTSADNPNTADNFIDEDDYELNSQGIVKWHDDFQVNDDLNLFWGTQKKQQWYQIKSSDTVAQIDLLIPIDNQIMQLQGTGIDIPVNFTVTRAGNPNASKSDPQIITVRSKGELPGGSEGLDGPAFKLNAAGVIAPILNPDGAEIYVPPYINIATGQQLTLTFNGFDESNNIIEAAFYSASRGLDDQDIVNGFTFKVPYIKLRTICTGFAEATLRVDPAPGSNQSPVNSKLTRVPVHMLDSIELSCSI